MPTVVVPFRSGGKSRLPADLRVVVALAMLGDARSLADLGRLFGADPEVLLMLAAAPGPGLRDPLRDAGFSATNEPRLWVGRLAGGIAHDFNNLLTVITGNVDGAMTELSTPPETAQRTRRSGPTCSRIRTTSSSMKLSAVQSDSSFALSKRKRLKSSFPEGVWVTSG